MTLVSNLILKNCGLKFFFAFLENLSPSELKKLRNKQRKAKKKAELETAQAAQALIKKEQYNKSRQAQNADGDPEAPQLDELVPEKLARPEDPLEKAIEFLKPLQALAKDNIETHLLAFEIYYRRNKVLLMLQSLKRAYNIDAHNSALHFSIIRYQKLLQSRLTSLDGSVRQVIEQESKLLFKNKNPTELNAEYLALHKSCPAAVVEVAKSMYILDPASKNDAVELLMKSFKDLKLKVSLQGFNKFQ